MAIAQIISQAYEKVAIAVLAGSGESADAHELFQVFL
jgi:hypothetical protein